MFLGPPPRPLSCRQRPWCPSPPSVVSRAPSSCSVALRRTLRSRPGARLATWSVLPMRFSVTSTWRRGLPARRRRPRADLAIEAVRSLVALAVGCASLNVSTYRASSAWSVHADHRTRQRTGGPKRGRTRARGGVRGRWVDGWAPGLIGWPQGRAVRVFSTRHRSRCAAASIGRAPAGRGDGPRFRCGRAPHWSRGADQVGGAAFGPDRSARRPRTGPTPAHRGARVLRPGDRGAGPAESICRPKPGAGSERSPSLRR